MKRTSFFWSVVTVLALSTVSYAARIEIAASEMATIQPEDSSLSPRILVKWNVPEELSDKAIEAAFVQISLASAGDEPLVVGMMPMTREWAASQVVWSSDWTKEGGDFDETGTEVAIATEGNQGAVTMDVRDIMRQTISKQRTDFGFIIVPDSTASGKLTQFDANASAKLGNARLTIVYRDQANVATKD